MARSRAEDRQEWKDCRQLTTAAIVPLESTRSRLKVFFVDIHTIANEIDFEYAVALISRGNETANASCGLWASCDLLC